MVTSANFCNAYSSCVVETDLVSISMAANR